MNTTKTVLFLLLAIFLIVFGPLLTIWALNTLFPILTIPYTWKTWLAVLVVKGLFTVNVTNK